MTGSHGVAFGRGGPVRRRASVVLGFTGLALLLLWPVFAPNPLDRMTIGTAADDFLRQFYPYRVFVADAWAGGHPPAWNPHQFAGTPAWADPQLAVLYPWRILQVPLALGARTLPLWAVNLEALAHLALGGLFTFGLVRQLGARPAAAGLSGVLFAAGGYLTGYPLHQLAVLDTAVWIPATLWALTAAFDARASAARRQAALLAGAATALGVLAGHPQTAGYALGAGLWWSAWRLAASLRARTLRDARGGRTDASGRRSVAADDPAAHDPAAASGAPSRILEVAGIWSAIAIGLSAAQWWPTLAFSQTVSRAPTAEELLAGLPVRDVVQLVAPHAVSCYSPLHVGAAGLVLAVWGGVRVRAARPWLALAGVAWLISLGGNGPIVPLLFRLAPPLALFRHQERIAVLVALGLAVAAGLALEALLSAPSRRAGAARVAGLVAALAAATAAAFAVAPGSAALAATCRPDVVAQPLSLAVADGLARTALGAGGLALAIWALAAGRLAERPAGLVVVVIAAFELVSLNRGRALAPPDGGATPVFAEDAIVTALKARARDGRVSSEALLPGGPNAASVHGLFDVTGDSPLRFAAVEALVTERPEMLWWRLLGVRFAVTDREIGDAEARLLTELARAGDRALYEIALPAPPAWAARAVVDPGWARRADFDPLACVVLDAGPVGAAEGATGAGNGPAGDADPAVGPAGDDSRPGESRPSDAGEEHSGVGPTGDCTTDPAGSPHAVTLTGLEPGRARVTARLASPAAVVLSTAFDPGGGWTASATGAGGRVDSPPVVRAYGVLPAVVLPAGEWSIEWRYRPGAVILGAVVSALTLVVALAGSIGATWWRRKPRTRR